MLGKTRPDVVWARNHKGSGLVYRLGALGAGAALGDHQRPDRFDGAIPALGGTSSPARQRCSSCAHGVEGVGFARSAAFLTIAAVNLHDPYAHRGHVAGQAGAVAAGALDADQYDRTEASQPLEQATVPVRGGRELLDAEQAADVVERGSNMDICVGVDPAGYCHGAFLYDGQGHPFQG
jgi:hypothetical protein